MNILRGHLRRMAIVTLKSGAAFRGVLFAADRDVLLLRNCEWVEAGADRVPTPVDGELVVLRPDVLFVQFP